MSDRPSEVAWLIKTPKGLYRLSRFEVTEVFKMGLENKANVLIKREADEHWSKPVDVRHLFFDSEFLSEFERSTLPNGFGRVAPSSFGQAKSPSNLGQAKPNKARKQQQKSLLTRNDHGEYECDSCRQGVLERVTLPPTATATGWAGIVAILMAVAAIIVGVKLFTATSGLAETAQELRDEAHLVLVRGGIREDLSQRVMSGSNDLGRDAKLLTISMQRIVEDAAEFVAEADVAERSLYWGRAKAIGLWLAAVGFLLFARISIVGVRVLKCKKCEHILKDD